MDKRVEAGYAASWTPEGNIGETTVTEAEWLECNHPQKMLEFLRGKASDRKFRLFAVACCRRIWHLLDDERSQHVVEMTEQYEERAASDEEMDEAAEAADDASERIITSGLKWSSDTLARHATAWLPAVDYSVNVVAAEVAAYSAQASALATEGHVQCRLVRDIFGNPFRPALAIGRAQLAWNKRIIVRLAQNIYDDRHLPDGTLDLARLAILADAIEEAGINDAGLLEHLRGPGPHVRGCFALDAILGRR
jgi:hypothetical protein